MRTRKRAPPGSRTRRPRPRRRGRRRRRATIARPRPVPGAGRGVGRAVAADEAVEDLLARLRRDAGAVVGDLDHGARRPRPAGASSTLRARRGVAGGVVEQVEDHPVQLVGVALDRQRAVVLDRQLALAQQRRRPRRRRRRRSRRGRSGGARRAGRRRRGPAAAGRRPGGSSAARSAGRSRRSRGLRPGSARRSEACSSSRLASTLVSGVRSSCEASATNSRCFCIARLALGAGGVERAQHLVERLGQLADLVVDRRLRHPLRGVAGVGDLARGRGQRGDRPHRPAGDREPGEAGEQGAAEDPGGDEEPEPADGRVDVLDAAPVLDEAGDRRRCRR